MFWNVLMCILAAWGILCGLWAAMGWLLPGSGPSILVLYCPDGDPDAILARCRWLLGLGLLRGKLIVTGEQPPTPLSAREEIEFCSLEELPARLEAERVI